MKMMCLDTFDDFAIMVNDSANVYLVSTAFFDSDKYSEWRYI